MTISAVEQESSDTVTSNFRHGFGPLSAEERAFLHSKLVDLLVEFDALCTKHGLEYYLDGGSVIGAVRHRGIIPWDDDADVLMKQSEFEKLLKVIDSELEERDSRDFAYIGRSAQNHRPFARYIRTDIPHVVRSCVIEGTYAPGVFIDIFILDGVKNENIDRYCHTLERSEDYFHRFLNGVVGRLRPWEYRTYRFFEGLVGTTRIERHWIRKITRWNTPTPDVYIPRNGFSYAIYDSKVFQTPFYAELEGHQFPLPSRPAEYLRGHYGLCWYMVPPVEERAVTHHTFTSLQFSTQELLTGFDWLEEAKKVRKKKAREHVLRIKRKPFAMRAEVARARIAARGVSNTLNEAGVIAALQAFDAVGAYREILESYGETANELRRFAKLGVGFHGGSEALTAIVRAYAAEGRADYAQDIASVVPNLGDDTREIIQALVKVDKEHQDGRVLEETRQHLETLWKADRRMLPLLVWHIKTDSVRWSAIELKSLIDQFAARIKYLDELELLYAEALCAEGRVGQSRSIFEYLAENSVNGLVALRAKDSLKGASA